MQATFSEFHKLHKNWFKNVQEDQDWSVYWQTHRPLPKEQGDYQTWKSEMNTCNYIHGIYKTVHTTDTDTSFEVMGHKGGKQNHNLLYSEQMTYLPADKFTNFCLSFKVLQNKSHINLGIQRNLVSFTVFTECISQAL